MERLYGAEPQEVDGHPQQPPPPQQTAARSRMSAEEQLERMKRHQRALVRERKRNLSQGDRLSNVSTSTAAATTAIAVATRPLTSDPSVAVRYPAAPLPHPGRHRTHHHHHHRDMAS